MKKYILFSVLLLIAGSCNSNARDNTSGQSNYQDQSAILALKDKCRTDGQKVHDQWVKDYFKETFIGDPEYAYNSNLKTCLWAQSYTGQSALAGLGGLGQIHDEFVIDVYTNKPVIEYTENNGKQISDISQDEFDKKKADLFNQQ